MKRKSILAALALLMTSGVPARAEGLSMNMSWKSMLSCGRLRNARQLNCG
jgi:hypothetical protein